MSLFTTSRRCLLAAALAAPAGASAALPHRNHRRRARKAKHRRAATPMLPRDWNGPEAIGTSLTRGFPRFRFVLGGCSGCRRSAELVLEHGEHLAERAWEGVVGI
jgi:hypothetical protein